MAAKQIQRAIGSVNLRERLRKLVGGLTAAALALSVSNCAFGQFGQTGIVQTGQSGFGQTGGSAFGQTGQTGQTGQGGLGLTDSLTSGLGQSGQSGFGANPFSTGGLSGQALSPYGRNGLIGISTTGGGTGGAGGATGGALGAASNLGGLTGAALNNRSLQSTLGGLGGRNQGRGNQNQNSTKSKIRATAKLGFEVASPTDMVATRAINDRLRRIPATMLTGVSVELSGRTAVIRGNVNSPSEGKVIERLLSLEPGIDAIQNELVYANGQAPANQPPSTTAPQQNSSRVNVDGSNAGTAAVQAAPEIVPAPDSN